MEQGPNPYPVGDWKVFIGPAQYNVTFVSTWFGLVRIEPQVHAYFDRIRYICSGVRIPNIYGGWLNDFELPIPY